MLVVVVVIWGFIKLFGGEETKVDQTAEESTPFTQPVGRSAMSVMPERDPAEVEVESLARLFVERMGSYSTQSDFQNIDDVRKFMTPRVLQWAEELKEKEVDISVYQAVETRVLTVELLEWAPDSSAVIKTSTQRQEQSDAGITRIYYQDAEVHLVYRNGGWLVDGIYWGDERE